MTSLKQFKTDATLEEQGATIEVADGITVQVRAMSSKKVRTWQNVRWRKDRGLYMNGNSPGVDYADKVDVDKCVDVLVLGWTGVREEETDTVDLPCTPENVRRVMTAYPMFRSAVIAGASEVENFRAAEVAAVAKNSPTPSTPGTVAVADHI